MSGTVLEVPWWGRGAGAGPCRADREWPVGQECGRGRGLYHQGTRELWKVLEQESDYSKKKNPIVLLNNWCFDSSTRGVTSPTLVPRAERGKKIARHGGKSHSSGFKPQFFYVR